MSHAPESALRVLPACQPPEGEPGPAAPSEQRRRSRSRSQFVDAILKGDRRILAQAITLIESSRVADRELAEEIIEECLPSSGRSLRVGITGIPGAGKSSLIEALGSFVIRECGQKIAVLAIDPTSQVTGGSILGDKTRMTSLASSEMAFIRPSPARAAVGGVAQHTREAILLCEAAGYEIIFVETVGVGQSETTVYDMVDFFLLMMLSGAGDELQGMKRGIMELADLIVVNKADGTGLTAAERMVSEVNSALHFFAPPPSGWTPHALASSAHTGRGLAEIWNGVRGYTAAMKASGWFDRNRREQRRRWMQESVEQGLMQFFSADPRVGSRLSALEAEVVDGRATPYGAMRSLLDIYAGSGAPTR